MVLHDIYMTSKVDLCWVEVATKEMTNFVDFFCDNSNLDVSCRNMK